MALHILSEAISIPLIKKGSCISSRLGDKKRFASVWFIIPLDARTLAKLIGTFSDCASVLE